MTERGQADLLIAIATSSDMTINHYRRNHKNQHGEILVLK